MWCQLWALGRANLGEQEGVKTVSASNIPLSGDVTVIPREMTKEDIARKSLSGSLLASPARGRR
jgi:2,4-dienoyl-CoA reductase-like NADH-dependent reductase (Old Yellow Enzyme family)